MREWLSGGAPPCQGGGRGFDPRLALLFLRNFRNGDRGLHSVTVGAKRVPLARGGLRSAPVGAKRVPLARSTVSRFFFA